MTKTYGLKYLLEGIYEAFDCDDNSCFVGMKVFIN